MTAPAPSGFAEILPRLIDRRDLSADQMTAVMEAMIEGRCGDAEMAALLIALRMKGETATELAAAAGVLRRHMVCLPSGRADVLDTSGTGGDGLGTFNISTAAALVVAAAGVPVVKHGNRAVTSKTGSADVLAELGLPIESGPEWSRRCLERAGFAFCLGPQFHPALAQVGPVRRRLPVRTIFNCLGPLANPAGAVYQLLGVSQLYLLDLMASALAQLGSRHAFVVCGRDGLDEVTLAAPTQFREVRNGAVTAGEWTPQDFGLEPCDLAELHAPTPQASAAVVRAVLDNRDGPARRIVLANAAAALLAADKVANLAEGVRLATEALSSGRAVQVLERLLACSS